MASYRDEVLDFLGVHAEPGSPDDVVGHSVPRRHLMVAPWAGPRAYSLGDDCRKEHSLLTDRNGQLSCLEVEVARLLRERWQAGWVQGFKCGWLRWEDWIWRSLPPAVAAVNDRIQRVRGKRPSSFSGHPDVAVTDGNRVVYIECKMKDSLKPSQIEWFGTAFGQGIVTPDDVVVVEGRTG